MYWDTASLVLLLAGHFVCAVALAQLGQSFSVMPEARLLVTSGIYSRIRHPLYLAEGVATLGILLQYRSIEVALLLAAHFAVQLLPTHEEEKVLEAEFPRHGNYWRRTGHLLPGFY